MLSQAGSFRFPIFAMPPLMNNHGNYIVSLGNVCRWLATQAEALGVEIYPGFAAAEVLYNEDGSVKGVVAGDLGVGKDGSTRPTYQPGMELHAKYTLIAEGARGSLAKMLMAKFDLRAGVDPQKFGIGIKELWQVAPDAASSQGLVRAHRRAGRSTRDRRRRLVHVSLRRQPTSPSASWCTSTTRTRTSRRSTSSSASRPIPTSPSTSKGGKRLAYGARAINEGGLQSVPKLTFPGGALIGCSAGFVNVPRIKGSHNAIKTGMLAAEAAFEALVAGSRRRRADRLSGDAVRSSWVRKDLDKVRNVKPALKWGTVARHALRRLRHVVHDLGIRLPWTLPPQEGRPRDACGRPPNSSRSTIPSRTACCRSTSSPRCSCRTPTTRKTSRRT